MIKYVFSETIFKKIMIFAPYFVIILKTFTVYGINIGNISNNIDNVITDNVII